MLLQTEYFQRHGIKIPEVQHTVTSGSLVLRVDKSCSQFKSRWLLIHVLWKDPVNHPGTYEVRLQQPVHNCHGKRDHFSGVQGYPPTIFINYEDFETFFRSFAQEEGIRGLTDPKEISLASWEIFLFCYDGYIASSASPSLQETIADALDTDLSLDERYILYVEATNKMIKDHYPVFERYDTYIHSQLKKGLPWLAKMINSRIA